MGQMQMLMPFPLSLDAVRGVQLCRHWLTCLCFPEQARTFPSFFSRDA